MRLLEFKLFSREKKKDDNFSEIVDVVRFDNITLESSLSEINTMMNLIVGKTVIFNYHPNFNKGEVRVKVKSVKYNLLKNQDDAGLKLHIKLNDVPIDTSKDIKILGKRNISENDPLGEEDWND